MSATRLRAPLALALVFSFASAHAQLSISNGSSDTEDIAAQANTGTSSTFPTGWGLLETGTNANTTYAADTGGLNSGNTYSYGAAGNSERAFGMLRSSSLIPTIGVQLVNSGGTPISSLDVAYVGEQWRLGLASRPSGDRLDFQYSTDATSLGTGTWINVDSLDFTSPVLSAAAAGALNGNVSPNRTEITGAITGINIAPGASLWVRWSDFDVTNSDDGLAIDDVRFGQAVDIEPTVASTSPVSGATAALDASIVVNFSEPVTVANGWFAFDCGAGTPALVASGGPTAYTLTHASPLPSGAGCTLTIENTLVTDQDGTANAMSAEYVLTFATAVDVAPSVTSTVPANAATNVGRGGDVQVSFSEVVTAGAGAFALECPDGAAIAFATTTEDNLTFSLDPAATLPASTLCELTVVAAQIADTDGTPTALAGDVVVTFTTAPVTPPVVISTVPVDGATNFPAAGDLLVSFDQNVTLAAGAFTLDCDTSTGIVLSHANSGNSFEIATGTALDDGDACGLHIEADAITSDDGMHPAADVDVVFAVASSGPGDYYSSVNTSSAGQLRCTLNQLIDGHTPYPYSASTTDTWDVLEIADQDPNDANRIVDVYKNQSYVKVHGGNDDYNREHTWPNSLGCPVQSLASYTDTHMLYLAFDDYNSARGNSPYGNCAPAQGCLEKTTVATNGFGGGSGVYPGNSNWNTGSKFETWNHRKGDVARAVMYMAIRYEGGDSTPDLELTDNPALIVNHASSDPKAYMGYLTDLLAWHQLDPPDQNEILRNSAVQAFQGNRNPFIDHPEWATLALFQSTTPPVCSPVQGVNTAPVANDDVFPASEDTALVQPFPGVLGNDTDAQNQSLSAAVAATVQHGGLALAANGSFTYTPTANYCGSDGFSYQASDGALSSATAFVTLNVACVNDAPVANDATFSLPENSIAGTQPGQVTASDIDAGQTLAYAITAGNAAGAFAIDGASGTISVASAAPLNFETTPQFVLTVTVTDNGSPAANDTATITINLSNVEEGPAVANDDSLSVAEDSGANVLAVLTNDTADPDTGSIAVTAVSPALHGSTSFTATGVTYTPAGNYCGADGFDYTVSGGDTAHVSMTVDCVNDAPVANDATFSLPENSAAGTQPGQVTASDIDAGQSLSYAITAGNAAGAFAINGTTGVISVANSAPVNFEVNPQFVLTVTVSDNGSPVASDTATITINLTNVEEGVGAANDDAATVVEDSGANTILVLANDAVDPDTGSTSVTGVSTAQHGTVGFTANNVSYTPQANYCGADSFTYTVSGGDTATVAVTVSCVTDAPMVVGTLPDLQFIVGQPVPGFPGYSQAFATPGPSHDLMVFRAEGMPPGLTAGPVGNITGTPTATGVYQVTAFAENSAGSVSTTFAITIVALPLFHDGFEN
jgi:VCBS repeat-containing protein